MKTEPVQFIGLGGTASGSGFVYTYLHEHPATCIPKRPTRFFSDLERYQKGVLWYAAHFQSCKKAQVRGEVSYEYLADPAVADRIAATVPRARLLAVVCDPIERLYREYTRFTEQSTESPMSFASYIDTYPESLQQGLFGKQLQTYFNLYSSVNLLVLVHEDRYRDPVRYIQHAYRFLEIDDTFVPKALRGFAVVDPDNPPPRSWYLTLLRVVFFPIWLLRIDRAVAYAWHRVQPWLRRHLTPRDKTARVHPSAPPSLPIDPELRSVLADYYAADVRTVSQLLGRDLNAEWDIQRSTERLGTVSR